MSWDTIGGYLFCLIFGIIGLAVAGWLLVTGQVIHSIDDLFLVLVCLLFAVICFGYLGWRMQAALAAGKGGKKKK
jgi:hypothetical protein